LDIDEAEVPDFVGLTDDHDHQWLDMAREWLYERGLAVLVIDRGEAPLDALPVDLVGADVLWIAGGPPAQCDVARSERHAVVYRGGSLEWDPHPTKAGLAAVHTVFLLVPIDPANVISDAGEEECPCMAPLG